MAHKKGEPTEGLDEYFNVYSNHPITIGSEWEKMIYLDDSTERDFYQYRVKNVRHDSVFIDMNGNVRVQGDTAKNGTPTVMSGITSGKMIINKNSGVVMNEDFKVQSQGTTVVNGKVRKETSSHEETDSITPESGIINDVNKVLGN